MINKKNLRFYHIPKTAGRFIKHYCFVDEDRFKTVRHNYCKRKKDSCNNDFKFSFVRNPYDRIFSAYYYLINGGINGSDRIRGNKIKRNCKDFKDFICDDNDKVLMDFVGKYETLQKDIKYILGNKIKQ